MTNFTCSESCGWISAFISCLSFGSFGVPIKSDAAERVDIDPLVMQTYKTIMCFLTSWLVLPLGEPFSFTPWGIVSGAFWVPSGTAAIFAIRNAGLAVSQGTWSALIVLVSFTWGMLIFDEPVKSKMYATVSICFMCTGLWGMSYYSSPDTQICNNEQNDRSDYQGIDSVPGRIVESNADTDEVSFHDDEDLLSVSSGGSIEMRKNEGMTTEIGGNAADVVEVSDTSHDRSRGNYVEFLGRIWSRRRLGLCCAIFNGLWGGSIMVPMHYSSGNTTGLGYVISFAIGASIICLSMWMLRFSFHAIRLRSMYDSYQCLPSFHLQTMLVPGAIAGSLWSIGNICSMLSVQGLGEGVGYSVVQSSMFVSGCWGMFYFREVTGLEARLKWLAAAATTIGGIFLLSYEHRNG